MESNIRTMEYIGLDDFSMPVYKCIETNILYKDIDCGNFETPSLHSCDNKMDGEPGWPISEEFNICFKGKYSPEKKYKSLNYQMLSRLKMDCDYYLGNGNRNPRHLWASDEKSQIEKMKALYNIFSDEDKPEWLTWEEILNYEKAMVVS